MRLRRPVSESRQHGGTGAGVVDKGGTSFGFPRLKDKIGMIPMEPGSLIMERKMLYGIKQRAERLAAEEKGPTHV